MQRTAAKPLLHLALHFRCRLTSFRKSLPCHWIIGVEGKVFSFVPRYMNSLFDAVIERWYWFKRHNRLRSAFNLWTDSNNFECKLLKMPIAFEAPVCDRTWHTYRGTQMAKKLQQKPRVLLVGNCSHHVAHRPSLNVQRPIRNRSWTCYL